MLPLVSMVLTLRRAENGLSMRDVAEMAGVEPKDVFEAENYIHDASVSAVWKIAEALNVDVDKIQDLEREFNPYYC
ncbi:helix-turn-helix transcriptional regulator [Alicyclobacillus cycloheptanicus]|uniref:Transcriptional regulator with XRE-family HTH domain n=1 Tax=Alicyclobacillus cycloheptanicus TaxID=1457 RepID=A0ABT9XES9_9BACL|nr:helix-turn-helix transcriptional regulator [Alicyclobacillus cycloheptanicus]MDQ0188251.1 transcriptional regulator with XRE-family HTH domain [Alicyclobacillus cycloheptanicus]WDM00975.1 helix-turn-helix transcriptional regulator [Alicyclobacillus cycloheptanicus]